MVSVLHANAKTTPRIRKEIQESTESIAVRRGTLLIESEDNYALEARGFGDGQALLP